MSNLHFRGILFVAAALVAGGCAAFPQSKFEEAHQSLPEIRAYALQQLPDLTAEERDIIQTHDPKLGQANFVIYYFWWQNSEGKTFATVEASPPPCKPYSARQSNSR